MAQIDEKYLCDGQDCSNSLDLRPYYSLVEAVGTIPLKNINETLGTLNNQYTAWGWRNINDKLYCKFCVKKAVTV